MSEIKQAIEELAGTRNQDEVKLYQAIVNSVDVAKRSCNVTTVTGNATLTFDAQLMAGVADGILIVPEVESFVYVLRSKYTIPFIIAYSDIVQYVLMGGEFGGLVKVVELTQKLNALEEKINQILTWSGTVSPPFTSPALSLTLQAEIENTSVKHGEN